jgi:isopentenyl diphosphate isomerase/L-lactate dehydrogenase-like FMN-dependent dehydrogenase
VEFEGSRIQNAIYAMGEPPGPIDPDEWETAAREKLPPEVFDYIAGGAGAEWTMRANLEAFYNRRIRPRMLTSNAERELSVEVLGTRSAAPFFLAPIGGVMTLLDPEGEKAVARAAAATGVPIVLSSAASTSLEDVAAAGGDAPRWFQLYWWNDRELAASLLHRAEASGYAAIVVTLDTLTLGWRPRDLRKAYLPFLGGEGIAQFTSDPLFRERLDKPPEEDTLAAALLALSTFPNLALSWADLAWLRGQTTLPIVLKGVLTREDAALARDAGVDGVIVSNHGGRQVDGAVAALDALPEVRDELGPDATVLMDSGIRRGADVFKALALGANAVLLGRPWVYGLAVAGQAGVETVIRNLLAEFDLTLALAGGNSARAIDRSHVT